ncbi:hypothetical protein AOLI_G00088550 [Acnodon oligacanthus]
MLCSSLLPGACYLGLHSGEMSGWCSKGQLASTAGAHEAHQAQSKPNSGVSAGHEAEALHSLAAAVVVVVSEGLRQSGATDRSLEEWEPSLSRLLEFNSPS